MDFWWKTALTAPFCSTSNFPQYDCTTSPFLFPIHSSPHPSSPFQPFFVGIRIETIGWDEYKITNCSRMKGFRGISFICVIVVAIAIFTADHHRTFRTIFQVFVVPFARRTVFPRTIINQDDQSCVCLRVFVLIFPLNWIWFIGDAQQRPNEKEYDRKDVKTVKSKWNGLLVRKSIE